MISDLVKNNTTATYQLNSILFNRITSAIKHHGDDLPATSVTSEMQLLTSMLEVKDELWQSRLRTGARVCLYAGALTLLLFSSVSDVYLFVFIRFSPTSLPIDRANSVAVGGRKRNVAVLTHPEEPGKLAT